jgi:hypothetical protein
MALCPVLISVLWLGVRVLWLGFRVPDWGSGVAAEVVG